MDCSLPGSSICGTFQARVLEWVAISFSRGSSWPRDRTQVSCIVSRHFTVCHVTSYSTPVNYMLQTISMQVYILNMAIHMYVLVTQLCLTLCDPMDYSPPGSSVHGILQARILESVTISFSRGSSWPRDRTQVSCIAGKFFTIWTKGKSWIHTHTHTHTHIYIYIYIYTCV